MSTQTGSYDLKAAKDAHDEAKKVATDYLTDVDQSGLMVHPENDSTSGWKISDAIELLKNGVSYLKMWLDNSMPKLRIGEADKTNAVIDYHSLQLIDKEGDTYLYVSDLRDSNGSAEITEIFGGNGSKTTFSLAYTADTTDYTVTVSDSSGGTITKYTGRVVFSTAPTVGCSITVEYTTASSLTKAYTLGKRDEDFSLGAYSVAEGYDTIANGKYAHAEGQETMSSGESAHAEGYGSIASGNCSNARGRYTKATGANSTAQGIRSAAIGSNSFAGGNGCIAGHTNSIAHGLENITSEENQTVIGRYNDPSGNGDYIVHGGAGGTTVVGELYYETVDISSLSSLSKSDIKVYAKESFEHNVEIIYYEVDGTDLIICWRYGEPTNTQSTIFLYLTFYIFGPGAEKYALVIGGGVDYTTFYDRKNILTVDWDGNVECGLVNGIKLQHGSETLSSVSGLTYVDVTFDEEFSSTPHVIVGRSTTASGMNLGGVWVGAAAVTTTGFRLMSYNTNGGTTTVTADWIAIGS